MTIDQYYLFIAFLLIPWTALAAWGVWRIRVWTDGLEREDVYLWLASIVGHVKAFVFRLADRLHHLEARIADQAYR